MQELDIITVIWLFPALFIFHDLEEIITVEHSTAKLRDRIRVYLPARLAAMMEKRFAMKTAQFAIAVTWVYLVLFLITMWTVFTAQRDGNYLVFLAALHVFFLHVFTHVGQSIMLRSYTPGVITAVLIVLPYSIYAYNRLMQAGLVDWHLLWLSLPISLLIAPLTLIGHVIGTRLIRN